MRRVQQIFAARNYHWVGNGFRVFPLFSHMEKVHDKSPFIMLDYAAPHHFAPNHGKPNGVGAHPHKGFETVTIAYAGEVAHRDSAGGGGVIGPGDVQWMTAGSGVVHEEFHAPSFSEQGGEFEMVQLWVNLPAAHKNTPPRYQHLQRDKIATVELAHHAGSVRVIAGDFDGVKGIAKTFSPMNVWDIDVQPNAKVTLPAPKNHALRIVVLRGSVCFDGLAVAGRGEWVLFDETADTDGVQFQTESEGAKLLLLSGEPIDEPIAFWGPFVMNTAEEIQQARLDYRAGKFGGIAPQNA